MINVSDQDTRVHGAIFRTVIAPRTVQDLLDVGVTAPLLSHLFGDVRNDDRDVKSCARCNSAAQRVPDRGRFAISWTWSLELNATRKEWVAWFGKDSGKWSSNNPSTPSTDMYERQYCL